MRPKRIISRELKAIKSIDIDLYGTGRISTAVFEHQIKIPKALKESDM